MRSFMCLAPQHLGLNLTLALAQEEEGEVVEETEIEKLKQQHSKEETQKTIETWGDMGCIWKYHSN